MLFDRILNKVMELVSRYGLLHPRELADYCGVHVINVPTKRVRGGFFAIPGLPVAAVSLLLPYPHQIGVLLHEVAHRVLHPETNRFMDNVYIKNSYGRFELEAHLFALIYAILWDRQGFEDCGYDVYRFAGIYGLSQRAADVVNRELQARGLGVLGIGIPGEEFIP